VVRETLIPANQRDVTPTPCCGARYAHPGANLVYATNAGPTGFDRLNDYHGGCRPSDR